MFCVKFPDCDIAIITCSECPKGQKVIDCTPDNKCICGPEGSGH